MSKQVQLLDSEVVKSFYGDPQEVQDIYDFDNPELLPVIIVVGNEMLTLIPQKAGRSGYALLNQRVVSAKMDKIESLNPRAKSYPAGVQYVPSNGHAITIGRTASPSLQLNGSVADVHAEVIATDTGVTIVNASPANNIEVRLPNA